MTKNINPDYGIPEYRVALPQIIAISIKNFLLFGYVMTVGFPTIVIPALQGGTDYFTLTNEEISWFSEYLILCFAKRYSNIILCVFL